jgi:5-methylcytosine-specific restriction endonuclease McrA
MTNNFYQTKDWYRIRALVLRRDEHCCVVCFNSVRGKGRARVDHIKTLKEYPELGLDINNLRTLCVSCDNKRHSEKRSGKEYQQISVDGFAKGW